MFVFLLLCNRQNTRRGSNHLELHKVCWHSPDSDRAPRGGEQKLCERYFNMKVWRHLTPSLGSGKGRRDGAACTALMSPAVITLIPLAAWWWHGTGGGWRGVWCYLWEMGVTSPHISVPVTRAEQSTPISPVWQTTILLRFIVLPAPC